MSNFQRHVEVTYCDDIRQEVGNKTSMMGVYSADLVIKSFPSEIQKLCIAIQVLTSADNPYEMLEIAVKKNDKKEEIELISTGTLVKPSGESYVMGLTNMLTVQVLMILPPFRVTENTLLTVIVKTEKEELNGVGLRIKALS